MALDPHSLEQRLAALLAEHDVPGASVSVLADGETCDVAAGVGDLRSQADVRTGTPFMIQSVTKVWTATLVMQLVDEGLVELDAPVTRYLPRFRTADPEASATITVRHLLTHTGGFEGDIWAATSDGPDALALFVDELVRQAPQHLPPGELFSYCNAGYGTLGRLVEVLRGASYAEALRRHLAEPLGVDGVATDPDEARRHDAAVGHVSPRAGEPLRPLLTWAVLPPSNPAAGNQLAMPAYGLTRLAAMHLADGVAPSGVRLLSAESARAMRAPQVDVPAATAVRSVRQGLGWRLTSAGQVAEHDGGAPGAGAVLKVLPEQGVAVAVLANGGGMASVFGPLCDELLHDLGGLVPTPPDVVPDASAVDGQPGTSVASSSAPRSSPSRPTPPAGCGSPRTRGARRPPWTPGPGSSTSSPSPSCVGCGARRSCWSTPPAGARGPSSSSAATAPGGRASCTGAAPCRGWTEPSHAG